MNPVIELYSAEDVELFMNTSEHFPEKNSFVADHVFVNDKRLDFQFKHRIVAFFSDVDDYSAEYSTFLSIAEKISYRYDLRIGIVKY